jgi:MFS family permease
VGCLSAIGYLFYSHEHLDLLVWFLMLYIGFFAMSHGAVVWVYISEVFPTRLRAKGQSLGSSSHWIANAVISLVFPLLAKASGSVPFFFFATMMVLDIFLIWFYYPETARISLENMQHTMDKHSG